MAHTEHSDMQTLLDLYKTDRQMFEHHENQRANLANIFMSAAGGVIAYLLFEGNTMSDGAETALALLAFAAASYGWLMSEKLSERADLHIERSRLWLKKIDEQCHDLDIAGTKKRSDRRHYLMSLPFSFLNVRWLWRIMFLVLTGLACGLLFQLPYITRVRDFIFGV